VAGRPGLRYKSGVGETGEVLRQVDALSVLPRLGGMARPNGVVIVSPRFWAFAGTDGSLREGRMPEPPEIVQRLPLVRGLARLALSLSPLFTRSGAAPLRERALIVGALAAPAALAFAPRPWSTVGGVAVVVTLLATIMRGPTLRLHGAEHRAMAAVEKGRLVDTWVGAARPSRFSPRCGTNFAALALPVTLLADRAPLPATAWSPFVVLTVSLALTMELWRAVQSSPRRRLRLLLAPGLALQRLTTREPRLHETRVALRAAASVLARELA